MNKPGMIAKVLTGGMLAAVLACWTPPATAGVAVLDAVSNWTGTATSLSKSYAVSSGAKVLVVEIAAKSPNAVPTFTWNGTSMILATNRSSDGTVRMVATYYLFNPAAGIHTLAMGGLTAVTSWSIGAFTLSGVDTTATVLTGSYFLTGSQNPVSVTIGGVAANSVAVTEQACNADAVTSGSGYLTNFTITGTGGAPQSLWTTTNDTQTTGSAGTLITGLSAGSVTVTATILPTGGSNYVRNVLAVAIFASQAAVLSPAIDNAPGIGATEINYTTANLHGNLTSTGGAATAVSVYWGTQDPTNGWIGSYSFGYTNTGALVAPATGLGPGTNYYYRYYATNTYGAVWASPAGQFTTLSLVPSITNAVPSNVATNSITLNGSVTGAAPITVYAFWGLNDGSTNTSSWTNPTNMGAYTPGSVFSVNLTGLIGYTNYFYRFMGSNANGIGWSPSGTTFRTYNSTVITWTNSYISGSWNTPSNWDHTPIFNGTEDAILGLYSTNQTTTTLDGDRWINSLTVSKANGGYFYIYAGSPSSSRLVVKTGNLTLTNQWHIQITAPLWEDDGTNANPNALWAVNNSVYQFFVNNSIYGLPATTITVTKTSGGITINSNNWTTYLGNWSLLGGVMTIGANSALGSGSVSITNNASLIASGTYVLSNNITLAGTATFGATASNVLTLAGNLAGNGAIFMGNYGNNGVIRVAGGNNTASGDISINQSSFYCGNIDVVGAWANAGNVDLSTSSSTYPAAGNSLQGNGFLGLGLNKKVYVKTIQSGHGTFIAPSDGTPLYPRADGNIQLLTNGTIGTLTIGTPGNNNSVEFPSNSWLVANVSAATGSTLVVNGLLNMNFPANSLAINGALSNTRTYTLAHFTSRAGKFVNVYWNTNSVANAEASGAINGTHKLVYSNTDILLVNPAPRGTVMWLR